MKDWYRITCYGDEIEGHNDLATAITAAEAHIRACPMGAMPWAEEIKWFAVRSALAAACGEWLNHQIIVDPPDALGNQLKVGPVASDVVPD